MGIYKCEDCNTTFAKMPTKVGRNGMKVVKCPCCKHEHYTDVVQLNQAIIVEE